MHNKLKISTWSLTSEFGGTQHLRTSTLLPSMHSSMYTWTNMLKAECCSNRGCDDHMHFDVSSQINRQKFGCTKRQKIGSQD